MSTQKRAVHVAIVQSVQNGRSYKYYLLRHSYREGGKVKHLTLGNISDLPDDLIDLIRKRLKGEPLEIDGTHYETVRSLPHGHVAAVLGTLRKIGLDQIISSKPCREATLITALIVSRIISPGSKLACFVGLQPETAHNSLAATLQLEDVKLCEIYAALDWLLKRQSRIEKKLAKRHLEDGTLVLYDVSSSYYTGRQSDLIQFGYSRDGKKDEPQIVYGLLCAANGCPVAIEVFPGNTADPTTFTAQVQRLRMQFGIARMAIVGDRGMITSKRIDQDLRGIDGLDWITSLRSDAIRKLVKQEAIAPTAFDERDFAEVISPDYPGERLIVCRNPLLAAERARKRKELLAIADEKLAAIAQAVARKENPLRGREQIGLRVGRDLKTTKMLKHFKLDIQDDAFTYIRKDEAIAEEALLDGLYVIRTSVQADTLSAAQAVSAYKDLSQVERAFRSLKTVDLHIRPIHHHLDERIRAHVFLCMLAYYLQWHLREALAVLLFDDHEREAAEADRASIVRPAPRSQAAQNKDSLRRTADNLPVQSFQCLLRDLSTISCVQVRSKSHPAITFNQMTIPTDLQRRVFELLGVDLLV